MTQPNFFILGAPKCGTTSLAEWLAEHPQIYFSPIKEPHHFNTDENWVLTPRADAYEALFKDATPRQKAVGEGSVWYLSSGVAVTNIEQAIPNARYLVCLRNPVEMAYSLHHQQIVHDQENVEDLARAWALSDARLKGQDVTSLCWEPRHLAYKSVCSLGAQLERLYATVPRERVHTCLLDDWKSDPRAAYLAVLAFLGVDDDGRTQFGAANLAQEIRWKSLQRFVQLLKTIKRSLGIKRSFRAVEIVNRLNLTARPRPPLGDDMRREMRDYFRDDIALLQRLLGRDLSHWLR